MKDDHKNIKRLGPAERLLSLAKVTRDFPPEDPTRIAAEEEFLAAALADDPKLRRYAAQALAHAVHPRAEETLLRLWQTEESASELKAVAKALGQRASKAALDALQSRSLPSDPLLEKLVQKALLTLQRDLMRPADALNKTSLQLNLDPSRKPNGGVIVELRCRAGLEGLLLSEGVARLGAVFRTARRGGTGRIRILWEAPLALLCELRVFEELAILVPAAASPGLPDAAQLSHALAQGPAHLAFRTWGKRPYRFRIDWRGAGKQREGLWEAAAKLQAKNPEFINDPRASDWELEIAPDARFWALKPKGLEAGRFSYRAQTVEASSHAPLAAALARVAGSYSDDIVWDPFAGAGTELIERAVLGSYAELHGSDRSDDAVSRARANFEAAGITPTSLECVDVRSKEAKLEFAPSLILTNPPLGRRVTGFDVKALLKDVLDMAGRRLQPGGRLVWVSPEGRLTEELASAAGLKLVFKQQVDMGGFHAELQRFDKLS